MLKYLQMLQKSGVGIVIKQQIIQGKHKVIHILSRHGRWSGIYSSHTHSIDLLTETEFIWSGKHADALGTYQCYHPTHFLPAHFTFEQSEKEYQTEQEKNVNTQKNQTESNIRDSQQIYLIAITLCELAMCIPERQACEEIWYHFQHSRNLLSEASKYSVKQSLQNNGNQVKTTDNYNYNNISECISLHENSLQIEAWMRFEAILLGVDLTQNHLNNPKEFFKQATIGLGLQYPDIKFLRARNYLYKNL